MKDKPIITVKIFGGLGNQMFQYAAAKSLAETTGAELLLDISSFSNQAISETPRNWGLHAFTNIKEADCNPALLKQMGIVYGNSLKAKLYRRLLKSFPWINNQHVLDFSPFYRPLPFSGGNMYLEGYWQSPAYFSRHSKLIKQQFDLSYTRNNQEISSLLSAIEKSNSVGIHVRRGDYVHDEKTRKVHFVCDENYYYAAINMMVQKTGGPLKFFIFSDDIEWCSKNLKISQEHQFVNSGSDSGDLYLMSICNHNIIANSTFSWWAAWLNKNNNKIVIAPGRWHNLPERNNTGLVLPDWIKIA